MPTALKLRQWESPLMDYAIDYAMRNELNRQIVILRLLENIESGSGHFSLSRAKQAVKKLAKEVGFSTLIQELEHGDYVTRQQAAELIGWMKCEKAIEPLVNALLIGPPCDRFTIVRVLRSHYANQLAAFIKRRLPQHEQRIAAIINAFCLSQGEVSDVRDAHMGCNMNVIPIHHDDCHHLQCMSRQ